MRIVGEGRMLQQWQADRLLAVSKIYTASLTVDITPGADHDYQVESDDETAFFLLDVRRSRRNPKNFRVQLRYQRDIVLARLFLSTPHANPGGNASVGRTSINTGKGAEINGHNCSPTLMTPSRRSNTFAKRSISLPLSSREGPREQ